MGVEPKIGFFTPQIIHLFIGSGTIIFTIHFGGKELSPLFLVQHLSIPYMKSTIWDFLSAEEMSLGWFQVSGDSWMYPDQRTTMGNPYISLYSGCLWVIIPKNPYIFAHKYHGYTYVRGTPVLVP